jgi:Glycosyltransferase
LKAITDIKKSNPDIEIFLIVPDLVQFMGGPKGYIYRLSRKYEINKLEKCYQQVNSYVFLSKYMVEALPIEKRTWCVIEGIYSEEKEITHTSLPDSKQILYTGTLARRYGIMNLLDAFNKIKNIDAKLIICGSGDCESEIMEAAKSNSNIIFKGLIDRKKVLQLQEEATLLVNPRTPEGEFTSYSFPSKTIEYLASGIPTLLYKLPGIPDEYYDYCFSIENNNTVEFLTKEIERILSLDVNYLRDFGEKARNFILNEKNPLKQCEKFFRLIENN